MKHSFRFLCLLTASVLFLLVLLPASVRGDTGWCDDCGGYQELTSSNQTEEYSGDWYCTACGALAVPGFFYNFDDNRLIRITDDDPTDPPSPTPTKKPSDTPTPEPTPTEKPTEAPTAEPTTSPTDTPAPAPTEAPSVEQQPTPTTAPTDTPVPTLTEAPSAAQQPSPAEAPPAAPSPTVPLDNSSAPALPDVLDPAPAGSISSAPSASTPTPVASQSEETERPPESAEGLLSTHPAAPGSQADVNNNLPALPQSAITLFASEEAIGAPAASVQSPSQPTQPQQVIQPVSAESPQSAVSLSVPVASVESPAAPQPATVQQPANVEQAVTVPSGAFSADPLFPSVNIGPAPVETPVTSVLFGTVGEDGSFTPLHLTDGLPTSGDGSSFSPIILPGASSASAVSGPSSWTPGVSGAGNGSPASGAWTQQPAAQQPVAQQTLPPLLPTVTPSPVLTQAPVVMTPTPSPAPPGPSGPSGPSGQSGLGGRNRRNLVRFPVFDPLFPARRLNIPVDPSCRAPVAGVIIWPAPESATPLQRLLFGR